MSKRIVVLISGRGSNLKAILRRESEGGLGGHVVRVFCNKPDAPGLLHAADHGVPSTVIDHRDYSSRDVFDATLAEAILEAKPDLVVLAGFMRILSGAFTGRFKGRLINTHPSLLPAFPGLNAVGQALLARVEETGCTVHEVVEAVDAGPILAQRRVPIHTDDTQESLEARVLSVEHQLLPDTIASLLRGSQEPEPG